MFANYSVSVAHDDIRNSTAQQNLRNCSASSAGSADHNSETRRFLFRQSQSVQQGGQDNYSRAVLVIVKNRDIKLFLKLPFNLKTARSRDVFQIDPSETDGEVFHGRNDFIRVFCAEADWIRIDV